MALEITTINGIDIIAQMFNAVAAITSNQTFFSLMGIAEIFGVVLCVVKYIQTRNLLTMGKWLLFFVLINGIMLTPKTEVLILDKVQTSKVKKVDNVPIGVAVPHYIFSLIGNSIAETYDTFMAQPDDLQYTKTGLLFGQLLIDDSLAIQAPNSVFNSNIGSFVKNCVIPDVQLNHKYSFDDLRTSTDLASTIFGNNQSELRNIRYTEGVTSKFITCKEAASKLQQSLNTDVTKECSSCYVSQLLRRFGIRTTTGSKAEQKAALQTATQSAYQYLMGVSKSASEIYKQNVMVNALKRELTNYSASLDSSADMIAVTSEQSLNKMRLSHLSSYRVANKMLPALYTVFVAFMVGIFPIVVLALFVTELTITIVKSYLGFLFSLMLYPVLFAIFNSFINTLTYQQLGGQSFTLSTADALKSNLADIAGISSYLMLSIPFISYGLMKNLGQAVSSAGSYLGNALSSSTSADAAAVSQGNISWGNMQMENINGFKTDLNRVFMAGKDTVQKQNGALEITNADGSQSYDAASSLSKLPFNVNWGKTISSSWNERSAMAISEEARNSQGVRESISNALSKLSGFNSGSTHSSMHGRDWADNDGVNKVSSAGENTSTGVSDTNSKDKSFGGNSSEKTNLSGSVSARLFGNGADVGHISDTGDAASHSNSDSVKRNIATGLRNGEDFSKIDGYIESVKGGITDTAFLTLLNNVQNDIREAKERYNDYVETETKSLTNSKESILSETNNVSVIRQLDSALYRHIKQNYSEEEQAEILNSAPTERGIALQNKAIQEVAGIHISDIVEAHHSKAEILGSEYSNYSIKNSVGESPSDISVNPNKKIDIPNMDYGDKNMGSSKKKRLDAEFEAAQDKTIDEYNKNRRINIVESLKIDERGKVTGAAAKQADESLKKIVR